MPCITLSRMVTKTRPTVEQLSVRLIGNDSAVLAKLEKKLGLQTASIIRLALRRLAEAEGLKVA